MVQSWDCAFKRTLTSDFVAGEVWGRVNNDAYLLDQTHVQADFPETLELIRATSIKWRGAEGKLIEDSANGTAVIQSLRHELTGIIPIQPLGGKESRANAVAAMIRSGNVYLPHPAFAPWVLDFIEECAAFPNGRHDDWVDAMTQALNQLNKSPRVLVSDEPADDDDYGEDDDDSYHAKSIREMQLLCCSY